MHSVASFLNVPMPRPRPTCLLAVFENAEFEAALAGGLVESCARVERIGSGEAALEMVAQGTWDVVVIGTVLQDMVGFSLLHSLRMTYGGRVVLLDQVYSKHHSDLAVFLGADKYTTSEEGIEAVREDILEGAQRTPLTLVSDVKPLVEIDHNAHQIRIKGACVRFTPKEFLLLSLLIEARGTVVSRAEIRRRVWGYSDQINTTTLETHLKQIRMKLTQFGLRDAIESIPKVGLRWDPYTVAVIAS